MKKAFSLALVLCMLLATVVIPTTAADPAQSAPIYNIPTDAETYTIDGVVYNVIRTADQFKAMTNPVVDGAPNPAVPVNYILAGDIDLATTISGNNCAVVKTWFNGILEGNGYAVYGYSGSVNNGSLFLTKIQLKTSSGGAVAGSTWKGTPSHFTFRNISFGKEDAKIEMTSTGGGSASAVVGKLAYDSVASFYNCKAYVNFTGEHGQKAAFVGCTDYDNQTISFEKCEAYGSILGGQSNGVAGFLGMIGKHASVEVSFKDCVNNVNVTGKANDVGGFIGMIDKEDTVVNFVNCVNNGTIVATNTSKFAGGLIGKSVSTVPVNVTVPVSEAASLNDGAFGSLAAYPNVTLMANGDGTASAGWQKTTADDNGKVKVRMIVAVAEQYLSEVDTMTFTGTFGLTAGGSKTLTMTLGGDKPVKYYSSVVAAGETLAAAEGYVLIPVVVENIPEADWDGTVSMKLTATGSDNVVAYYQYN